MPYNLIGEVFGSNFDAGTDNQVAEFDPMVLVQRESHSLCDCQNYNSAEPSHCVGINNSSTWLLAEVITALFPITALD